MTDDQEWFSYDVSSRWGEIPAEPEKRRASIEREANLQPEEQYDRNAAEVIEDELGRIHGMQARNLSRVPKRIPQG